MFTAIRPKPPRWQATLQGIALRLADSLLARACAGCSQPFEPGAHPSGWCEPCLAAIRCDEPRCPRCALQGWVGPCEGCRADPPPFERTVLVGGYAPPLDRIIRVFKFRRDPALGRVLAAALVPNVASLMAHTPPHAARPLVVPVPLSTQRLAERGYNQALLIARPLARACGLQLEPALLRRTRAGPAQSSLAPGARHRNVEQAFVATASIRRPVLLVDDVMTTGATLADASRALLAAGAPSITCVVLARTPPPDASRRSGSS